MRGNSIELTSEPKGMFLEGTIDDASAPGTLMEVVPGAVNIGGRPHFRHYQPSADGDPRMWAVLLEDDFQGFRADPAGLVVYTIGKRCRIYVPLVGEEINVLVRGAAGTGSANAFTVGERFIGGHTDGKLVSTATSSVSSPFMSMEHIDAPADVDQVVWCMRT